MQILRRLRLLRVCRRRKRPFLSHAKSIAKQSAGRSLGRRRPAVRCRTCVRSAGCSLNAAFFICGSDKEPQQPAAAPGRRAAFRVPQVRSCKPTARLRAGSELVPVRQDRAGRSFAWRRPALAFRRSAPACPSQAVARKYNFSF